MSKILITGATGGLGSNVAEFLKEKIGATNIAVLVRDKNAEKAKHYLEQGFDIRVADYDNLDALKIAFANIDMLYFVSGSDINNRLSQHENVVNAAKEVGIKHILYTSTVRNDETEKSPLHLVVDAHIKTEEWIKESGITYTILRHNLYAEVVPMFIGSKEQLQETKTVYLPTGDGKTAFALRKDFAEAEAIILNEPEKHANKIYEFNGSKLITFNDIATYLSEVIGETINYVSPTVPEFEATLKSVGLPAEIIGMTTGFSLGIASGEFEKTKSDLETILGRKTQILSSFIKKMYK
ncbi:SDR family oxidoreductase [Bernardetia sp. OM2101]|uniref:SDR family oxidoreductase n=1 Tax=Bernardetia sp. OM2101 TaxID=3344876 RepID=UPI0035CECF80